MSFKDRSAKISPRYLSVFVDALFQQALAFALTYFVLDSARATRFVFAAVLAHWLAMLLIVVRRPELPTRTDFLVFRFGFVPLLATAWLLAPLVWRVAGEHASF